jgi:hypothetical protein
MDTRLDQAIRTLRAIRQRYETESDAGHGRKRSYAVQIALGYADMRWIGAAIEALEQARTGRCDPTLAVSDPPYAQVTGVPTGQS